MNSSPDPGSGFLVGIFLVYGFFILLALASFVFWIIEIIDVARRQFPEPNTKTLWLLVVVLGHGIGAIVYYFAGKPTGWLPGETPRFSNYPPNYPPITRRHRLRRGSGRPRPAVCRREEPLPLVPRSLPC